MAADPTRLPDPLDALEEELLMRESLEREPLEREPLDLGPFEREPVANQPMSREPLEREPFEPIAARRVESPPPASPGPRRRPALTIILPVYNEEKRLRRSFAQLRERSTSERWGDDFELIVVDDGSADRTVQAAREELAELAQGRLVRLPWHAGKGAAVRLGMAAAHGDAIVFMDADLATDLSALAAGLAALGDADVVIGSRKAPGAVVTGRSKTRRVLARGFGSQARRLTSVPTDDPQCGFKAFRSDVAKVLFSMSRVDGFGFDVEILLLAQKLGYRITELPVRWHAVEGSHVDVLRDPLAMFRDLVRVRRRFLRKVPLSTIAAAEPESAPDARPRFNGRERFAAPTEPTVPAK